ncbi:MAG: HPr family phosphocarrier protein [Caulobacterales bacterium]|nr:HPr family phosphocarrier protein [Caulobacterales bacterium]
MTICNAKGLHARASAKLVKAVNPFDAEVQVGKDGQSVDARSIMGLLMLGAGKGSDLTITADGPDAEAALAAVVGLVEARFDEDC